MKKEDIHAACRLFTTYNRKCHEYTIIQVNSVEHTPLQLGYYDMLSWIEASVTSINQNGLILWSDIVPIFMRGEAK